MREYGKILGSIVLALFTLATVLAASTVLYDLATGKDVFAESFTLPYLVAMMGFILFGVSGSLLWYFFLRILGTAPASFLLRHALAARSEERRVGKACTCPTSSYADNDVR